MADGRVAHGALALVLVCAAVFAVGCASTYQVRGRVIRGMQANVELIDSDDDRITGQDTSAGGAIVWAVWEPGNGIDRKALGRFVSDAQGNFSIPVDEPGAGFLIYEIELTARRTGHQGVAQTVRVPGMGQRVLITLPHGADTLRRPDDLLERTLRDAEPYLDGRR